MLSQYLWVRARSKVYPIRGLPCQVDPPEALYLNFVVNHVLRSFTSERGRWRYRADTNSHSEQLSIMTADGGASETSPLLPKPTNLLPEPADAPNGALPNGANGNDHTHDVNKSVNEEEASTDQDGRERQYQGMPEVKKQLKYIVPAVAIGV